MADRATIKRLTFHKKILAKTGQSGRDRSTSSAEVFAEHVLKCDPRSLKKAAQSVGLDHTHAPHLSILVRILAHELFGRTRGKKRGDRVWWNDSRVHALISKAREIKSRNPKFSDAKIAKLICEDGEFKRVDSEPIRQRLSRFREYERLVRDAGLD
jgi:hypothetical protein